MQSAPVAARCSGGVLTDVGDGNRFLRTARRRARRGRRRRSSPPTASWRCSITPTATRGARTTRPSSRRSAPPTSASRTRRSAPPTTATATPRSSTAAAAAGQQADFGDLGDIFETIFGSAFGGGGGRGRPRRGADLRYDMEVGLEDAFHGKTTEIEVEVSVACEPCGGSGAEPGTSRRSCELCRGHGKVRAQQGLFVIERPCPSCHGRGEVIESPCRDCRGEGRVDKVQKLEVEVPPGVDNGTRIRLNGKGEAGPHGRAAGRPLHLRPGQAAPGVRARGDRAVHPRAGQLHHRRARRHDRHPRPRRRNPRDRDSRRHPVRPPAAQARRRHAGAARRAAAATW